jgi:hypothetical protein
MVTGHFRTRTVLNDLVQELADKQAITEVIYTYARGLDRMDKDMTLSCWHEGGTDNHGALFNGTAEEFVTWLWPIHAAMELTQHTINNILIELDGDRAGTEAYYTVYLRTKTDDGFTDIVGGGRYCDTFERIDGRWAIRHRESIGEWVQTIEVGAVDTGDDIPPSAPDNVIIEPRRDRQDYSYSLLKYIGIGKDKK